MKGKKIVITAIGIVLFGLIGYGVFIGFNKNSVSVGEKITVTKDEDGEEREETFIEIDDKREIPVGEEFPNEMTEGEVRQAIHSMSHQKIKAEDKWGFLPLTKERVERLIEVVEINKKKYNNADIYLGILNRWEKSDFSKVDSDHNVIWDLQGGTVGEAYGIMSIEEEREYIKKHFKVVEKK